MVSPTRGGPNQVGAGTFLILRAMRLSAKPKVFLGVRNLAESFFPDHLAHLRSSFRRRPANALFPFSVSGSTIACAVLSGAASAPDAGVVQAAGFTLLGTFLAVLERWFMVPPLPFEALWRWGPRSRRWTASAAGGRGPPRLEVDHGVARPFPASLRIRVAASPGAAAEPRTALGRTEAT